MCAEPGGVWGCCAHARPRRHRPPPPHLQDQAHAGQAVIELELMGVPLGQAVIEWEWVGVPFV